MLTLSHSRPIALVCKTGWYRKASHSYHVSPVFSICVSCMCPKVVVNTDKLMSQREKVRAGEMGWSACFSSMCRCVHMPRTHVKLNREMEGSGKRTPRSQLGSAASNEILSQRKWKVRTNNPGCPLTSIHTIACLHPHIFITYIHAYLTSMHTSWEKVWIQWDTLSQRSKVNS